MKGVSSNLFTKNIIYHENTRKLNVITRCPRVRNKFQQWECYQKIEPGFPGASCTCRYLLLWRVRVCKMCMYTLHWLNTREKHFCVRGVKLVEFICIQQHSLFLVAIYNVGVLFFNAFPYYSTPRTIYNKNKIT